MTGYVRSNNFPVLTPFQPSRTGNRDTFLTKIDPSLSGSASLRYSTYLGGDEEERGTGVAVDGEGRVYLTGYTRSDGPSQGQPGGTGEAAAGQVMRFAGCKWRPLRPNNSKKQGCQGVKRPGILAFLY